jgi:hypothetical protein
MIIRHMSTRHLYLNYCLIAVIAFAFAMPIGACGGVKVKTGISPVADIANAGGKIEESGQAIFQAVTKARVATPNIVSQKAADDVAIAVNKLGHAGLILNDALTAYNTAKAAGTDLTVQKAAIQQELTVVNQFLTDIGKALPTGTLQAVDALVNTIIDAVLQVKVGVGL